MKTGVVYLKIRLELNMDIDEDEVGEFVSELDYSIKDNKNLIANTEIVESSTTSNI
jgi:hypothetical protein